MKDAATILKELGCDDASVNGYRNEIWIEYDHTKLVSVTEREEHVSVHWRARTGRYL